VIVELTITKQQLHCWLDAKAFALPIIQNNPTTTMKRQTDS